jgi:hypothetical protein
MSMFCIERRRTDVAVPRHEAWWAAVKAKSAGTVFAPYVQNLERLGNRWLVLDEGFLKSWEFFAKIPGWDADDGLGKPLTVRKLSVAEEHYAARNAPESEKATFVDRCLCPPNLPRRVRREADRASKKLIENSIKKAMRQS